MKGHHAKEGMDFRQKLTLVACMEVSPEEDRFPGIDKGKVGRLSDNGSDAKEELLFSPNLVRALSLPPNICRAQSFREDDMRICVPRRNMPMRQVSLNLSDLQPPRHSSKGHRSDRYLGSLKSGKSLSELEREEVQGFKDLGFSFEEKDINQNLVGILPGLQEKRSGDGEDKSVRRPYLSEAWNSEMYAIPKWNAKGSPEDMKADIRKWAREVASKSSVR